jgi:hypothetical protein
MKITGEMKSKIVFGLIISVCVLIGVYCLININLPSSDTVIYRVSNLVEETSRDVSSTSRKEIIDMYEIELNKGIALVEDIIVEEEVTFSHRWRYKRLMDRLETVDKLDRLYIDLASMQESVSHCRITRKHVEKE